MIEKIRNIIASQLNLPMEKVLPTSKIVEDLGADSLDIVELLMSLEEQFGITLSDDQAAQMKTINDIAQVISSLKK